MNERDRRLRKRAQIKAETGDVRAMMDYCSTFPEAELQRATKEEKSRVLRYLRTASRKGNAEALCNLGAMYYGSSLVPQNYARALDYYERSAKLGCVQAMSNLGYCHYYGRSVPIDYGKACGWFLKAYLMSGGRQPESCFKLGDCYRYGKGVETDLFVAKSLYDQAYAAAFGYMAEDLGFDDVVHGWDDRLLAADAASRLGDCHRDGLGCEKDLKAARRYYRVAVRGFMRKVELMDPFAPALLASVKKRLAELKR